MATDSLAPKQHALTDFDDDSIAPSPVPGCPIQRSGASTPDTTWAKEVEKFLLSKQKTSSVGEGWIKRMGWELGRVPSLQSRLGSGEVRAPADVGPEHLKALREKTGWEKQTIALHFVALRQFLRWAGNPLVDEPWLWKLPSGHPSRRRWLTREQLLQLYSGSEGLSRLMIALEAFNGLRRVEVLRLRVRDVLMGEGSLRVLGKGRNGGKWRQIPLHPAVAQLLHSAIRGKSLGERLVPRSSAGADYLLEKAARASGLSRDGVRVSHHDLRRTFGRLAHEAGMDLVQLKNLYGHGSIEMTVHYIGFDTDEMRTGLARLGRFLGVTPDSHPAGGEGL